MVFRSGVDVVELGDGKLLVFHDFRGPVGGGYTAGSGFMVSTPEVRKILKVFQCAADGATDYTSSISGAISAQVKDVSGNITTISVFTSSGEIDTGIGLSSFVFRLGVLGMR